MKFPAIISRLIWWRCCHICTCFKLFWGVQPLIRELPRRFTNEYRMHIYTGAICSRWHRSPIRYLSPEPPGNWAQVLDNKSDAFKLGRRWASQPVFPFLPPPPPISASLPPPPPPTLQLFQTGPSLPIGDEFVQIIARQIGPSSFDYTSDIYRGQTDCCL